MICVDPKKRATIDEVKNHPWVTENCPPINNFVPERPLLDPFKLNRDIVQRMVAFGYKQEETFAAFSKNRPSPVKATYYLLGEMLQREEKKMIEKKRLTDGRTSIVSSSMYSLSSIDDELSTKASEMSIGTTTPSSITKSEQPPQSQTEIRQVNGWFLNVATTSSKSPDQIIQLLLSIIQKEGIQSKSAGFVISCFDNSDSENPIEFEIEICKIPKLSLHGLHFKRLNGSIWVYKKVCSRLVQLFNA